jgi:hypothetical protein
VVGNGVDGSIMDSSPQNGRYEFFIQKVKKIAFNKNTNAGKMV